MVGELLVVKVLINLTVQLLSVIIDNILIKVHIELINLIIIISFTNNLLTYLEISIRLASIILIYLMNILVAIHLRINLFFLCWIKIILLIKIRIHLSIVYSYLVIIAILDLKSWIILKRLTIYIIIL